jgi:hypothetical protein
LLAVVGVVRLEPVLMPVVVVVEQAGFAQEPLLL